MVGSQAPKRGALDSAINVSVSTTPTLNMISFCKWHIQIFLPNASARLFLLKCIVAATAFLEAGFDGVVDVFKSIALFCQGFQPS